MGGCVRLVPKRKGVYGGSPYEAVTTQPLDTGNVRANPNVGLEVVNPSTKVVVASFGPTGAGFLGNPSKLFWDADGNLTVSGLVVTGVIYVGGAATDVNSYSVKIAANRIQIDSTTTFSSGYDPSTKEIIIHRGTTAPTDTSKLWLDTSVTPNILKRYSGGSWIKASPTTLDEISDGTTYARVKSTQISAGEIVLTSTDMQIDKYGVVTALSGTRVELKATGLRGYNGSTLMFEIRASDGKAYFAGGSCWCDDTGLTLKGDSLILKDSLGAKTSHLYTVGTGSLQVWAADGNIVLNPSTYYVLPYTSSCYLGNATDYWAAIYADKMIFASSAGEIQRSGSWVQFTGANWSFSGTDYLAVKAGCEFYPATTNTGKVGTSTYRFAEIRGQYVYGDRFYLSDGTYLYMDSGALKHSTLGTVSFA